MWEPENHLKAAVLKTLREAEFSEDVIEFLGWLSWCANALNNNKYNVVKAAHTLLAKETVLKMIPVYIHKKKDSVRPAVQAEHPDADDLFRGFARWKHKNVPETETGDPYAPEE